MTISTISMSRQKIPPETWGKKEQASLRKCSQL